MHPSHRLPAYWRTELTAINGLLPWTNMILKVEKERLFSYCLLWVFIFGTSNISKLVSTTIRGGSPYSGVMWFRANRHLAASVTTCVGCFIAINMCVREENNKNVSITFQQKSWEVAWKFEEVGEESSPLPREHSQSQVSRDQRPFFSSFFLFHRHNPLCLYLESARYV